MDQDNWRNNSERPHFPPQWNSPAGFRGHSPRYRGGGGGWQQQQSPYPYYQQQNYSPRYASTPYRQRGNYSGRRGGGRYNNSNRGGGFNPHHGGEQGIEAWVSAAMWEDPWKDLINKKYPKEIVPEQPTKFLNESSEIDISFEDDGANQTSEVLGVSDMIMKSGMESVLETSGNPLPDISLGDLVKCPIKAVTQDKTDQQDTQDAKDLLSIL